jgi:hypothetical protein
LHLIDVNLSVKDSIQVSADAMLLKRIVVVLINCFEM